MSQQIMLKNNLFEKDELPKKELPKKELPKKELPKKELPKGGSETSYPSTPFKDTTESDAFRTWLLTNYPDYGDAKTMGKLSVDKAPSRYTNSKSLRKAYFDKGKEYELFLKSGNKPGEVDRAKEEDSKVTDQQQQTRKQEIEQRRQMCSSWVDSYFDREFGTAYRNVEAGRFAQWVERKFPRLFKELSVDEGEDCGVDKYYRFLTYPSLYKHRFLKTLSDAVVDTNTGNQKLFDLWFSEKEKKNEPKKQSEFKIEKVDGEVKITGDLPTGSETTRPSYLDLITISNLASDNNYKLSDCRKLVNRYYEESKKGKDGIGLSDSDFSNEQSVIKSNLQSCLGKHNVGLGPNAKNVKSLAMNKYFVLEEKNTMKSKLIEIQENNMIKESIVNKLKERKSKDIDSIFENYERQNYRKFFDLLMTESKMYNCHTLLNEQGELTFQQKFDSMFQTSDSVKSFKEKSINYILTSLKVTPESPIGVEIKNELESIPDSEVSKLVSDPTFVANKVTSAIGKTMNAQTPQGDGGLKDIIHNNTVTNLKNTMDDIKFQVVDNLRDSLTKTKTNLETTANEIKKSFIEKLKSQF